MKNLCIQDDRDSLLDISASLWQVVHELWYGVQLSATAGLQGVSTIKIWDRLYRRVAFGLEGLCGPI